MNDYELNEVATVAAAATKATIQEAVAGNENRLRIISEMEETWKGFSTFYGSDACKRAMAEHPVVAQAVLSAEAAHPMCKTSTSRICISVSSMWRSARGC